LRLKVNELYEQEKKIGIELGELNTLKAQTKIKIKSLDSTLVQKHQN
jgi:hypothetical protein